MKRIILSIPVLFLLSGLFLTHLVFADSFNNKVNLGQLKKECEIFENILNTSLRQIVDHPMFLSEKARGSYLEGYGIIFNLTIDLNRKLILFPREPKGKNVHNPQNDRNQMVKKIRINMMVVMAQYGGTLKQLPPEARISIVTHVLSRSILKNQNYNRVLVLTAAKRDIDQYLQKKINLNDFKNRVKHLEY